MIKEEWQQIKENQDVRQNLSRLRQEIKDKDLRRRFSELIRGEEFLLTELLRSEDAKTRKIPSPADGQSHNSRIQRRPLCRFGR